MNKKQMLKLLLLFKSIQIYKLLHLTTVNNRKVSVVVTLSVNVAS